MALTEQQATARAQAEVRAYCGWHVAPSREETLTLDGDGSPLLVLPTLHVSEVTEVTEDGATLPADSYSWSTAGLIAKAPPGALAGRAWTRRFRGVTVTLTHGHPDFPLDVQAVIERLSFRAQQGAGLVTQVGQVGYATGEDGLPVGGTLSLLDRAVLNRYRLPSRP